MMLRGMSSARSTYNAPVSNNPEVKQACMLSRCSCNMPVSRVGEYRCSRLLVIISAMAKPHKSATKIQDVRAGGGDIGHAAGGAAPGAADAGHGVDVDCDRVCDCFGRQLLPEVLAQSGPTHQEPAAAGTADHGAQAAAGGEASAVTRIGRFGRDDLEAAGSQLNHPHLAFGPDGSRGKTFE